MKSVIEASSAGVKDMADGSLRITFEFEPKDAADAFALFGTRGRAVGVAALIDGRTQINSEEESEHITPEEPEKLKGGALARLAGQWCKDKKFEEYWKDRYVYGGVLENPTTNDFIKWLCGVNEKKEIDHNEEAIRIMHQLRHSYSDWLHNA